MHQPLQAIITAELKYTLKSDKAKKVSDFIKLLSNTISHHALASPAH